MAVRFMQNIQPLLFN